MHGVLQHEGVGRAGIEPDVADVVDLLPVLVGQRAEETLPRPVHVPGIGAFQLEGVGDALVDGGVLQDIGGAVALLAHEHRDRHAPGALARDHPVGTARDHAVDAVLARGRYPLRHRDRVQRAGAQRVAAFCPAAVGNVHSPGLARGVHNVLVHRDEPLRRVAEDHRLLGAPGMRILVFEAAARQQHAGPDQRLDHGLVGVALLALVVDDAFSRKARGLIGQRAVLVDGVGDGGGDAACLQSARARRPDIEILAAVAGRGMDEAGAGVGGDVVAFEQRHAEFITAGEAAKRMRALHRRQRACRQVADLVVAGDAGLLEHRFGERVGQDQQIARFRPVVRGRLGDAIEPVGDFRREADGAVARQRPRRGGPDHDAGIAHGLDDRFRNVLSGSEFDFGDRKLHPYRIRRVVLVFDLGFRQRGLFHHAPHHRLGAAIQRAVGGELHQLARDLGLGEIIHGGVGVVPVADDAEPLEFLALHVEPVRGIGAAFLAERHHRGGIPEIRFGLALGAVVLLLDLPFDRQAVAVPARHVVGIEAEHLLALGHDVLEDLVEGVPDMDVAVGVGRAVMQHEFRPSGGIGAEPLVKADFVPALEDFRLALRQAGAHREFRLRQEQGPGIVGYVWFLRLFGHECSGLAQRALKRDWFADEWWRSRSCAEPKLRRKPGR